MRVVIVDDEPMARRGIRQLLEPHRDVEIAGEARNGADAVRVLREVKPDLVFLDVQMPELDGFEVLRRLDRASLPDVIFVTAHDTFAVRAFEEHALDYLVKPVHEARFEDALARARGRPRIDGPRLIIVPTNGSDLLIHVADIDWIEADDYYAAIHTRGKRHLVRESLASLAARLGRLHFVRVHRSAIVNLAQVSEVRDAAVVLRNGVSLPLSRRRREAVADAVRRLECGDASRRFPQRRR